MHYFVLIFYHCFFVAEVGLIAKGFMDEGKLVPDDIITTIVVDELKKYEQDSWLLDGKFRRVLFWHFGHV